jgi:peptidoglycan/LPS O-acetylase OafA/YrhL
MSFIVELPNRLRRITSGGGYKAEIDGLRFWAIFPVVLWHGIQRISRAQPDLSVTEQSMMLWVPEARVGVMLFLTISGFIISTQFIKARALGRDLDLRTYFYRRVTRIEPPYLLLLVATYLFLTLTSYMPENAVAFWRGEQSNTASFLASVFYLHGIVFNEMPRLFPGGWSLEVEVQFYVLAPAIFALFYFVGTVRRRLIVGVVVLVVAFAIARYFDLSLGTAGPHRYTLIRYFFYFWLGTLIAEINHAGSGGLLTKYTSMRFELSHSFLCSPVQ